VKRIVLGIGTALLLVSGFSMYGSERGETAMKSTVIAAELPPIDRVIPAKLETATFAMG
jgi:hypothetical protein